MASLVGEWGTLVDPIEAFPAAKPLAMRHLSERQVICEMKLAPPLSHEIRYAFSVHGGLLTAGVAILHRNVFLMA